MKESIRVGSGLAAVAADTVLKRRDLQCSLVSTCAAQRFAKAQELEERAFGIRTTLRLATRALRCSYSHMCS